MWGQLSHSQNWQHTWTWKGKSKNYEERGGGDTEKLGAIMSENHVHITNAKHSAADDQWLP